MPAPEENLPSTKADGSQALPPVPTGRDDPDAYPGFEVKGELGRGGMGTVYLARERGATRDVALKVLVPTSRDDPWRRTHFLEEAHVTAQLQHPGIVPIYRIDEDRRSRPYYTMRPIEGRSLAGILDGLRRDDPAVRDRFPLRRLVQVFQSCCQTVRFAHDRGVIHRDLKPSNVVVGDYGEVLVIDWGLAKPVAPPGEGAPESGKAEAGVWTLYDRRIVSLREEEVEAFESTADGALIGTPAYMSPEQALGRVRDLGVRSDIWSLGVMLYELCTLRLPFEGKSLAELTRQITTTDPPDPMRANPQRRVPPELADSILRCLRRDPAERYPSLAELLLDVENWLEGIAPWKLVKDVDFTLMPDGEPEGWTCVKGRWRVLGGALAGEEMTDNILQLDAQATGDVRVELDAMVAEGRDGEITLLLCLPETGYASSNIYSLQFGAHSNTTATIQRGNIDIASTSAGYLPGRWHTVIGEKIGNLLRLSVDGRELLRWRDPEPLSGSRVALYCYRDGLRVRRFRLFSRGLPLTVSCLAVPDTLFEKGLMEDARSAYLDVAENHPAREEGLRALFRAGKCSLALAMRKGTDAGTRGRLFDEAWGFFERIEGSPSGPLACLGKSLVHEARAEVEEEARQLERAYRDYPGYEGLIAVGERLWERALFFLNGMRYIHCSLFGIPALRYHPGAMTTGLTMDVVVRLPDVALAEACFTDFLAKSASPYHRALARHCLVLNWIWNGRLSEAERQIQDRLSASEGDELFYALLELVMLRARQRRPEEQLACLQRIQQLWPSDPMRFPEALAAEAGLYFAMGRCEIGEAVLRRILAEWPAFRPRLHELHSDYGRALFTQGRFDEAEREWRLVLQEYEGAHPSCVKAQIGLSQLCIVRGDGEGALRLLEEAYETYKDRGPVLWILRAVALTYALAGHRGKVLEALQRSAEVYPDFAARLVLHPDDPAARAAWEIYEAQCGTDREVAEGLAAYARGDDASAARLLARASRDGYSRRSTALSWPVSRLIEQLEGKGRK
jgi:serine/threonine protein kinase/tetratricopeptide (TPR) repeat protein